MLKAKSVQSSRLSSGEPGASYVLAAEFVVHTDNQIIAVDDLVDLSHRKHWRGRSDGISRKNRWPCNGTCFGHSAGYCC